MHTEFLSLLCWSCEGFLFSLPVGICLVRVFSRLSGCTPSDPSQFARHCRIQDHFQLLLSFFSLGVLQFPCPPNHYDKFLSAYEHCRASACQCPTAVSPFNENTNAEAWTLLELVFKVLVDHVYPSGGVVFHKVNWVKPAHGPGSSMSPSTFQMSLTFLQHNLMPSLSA